jgi:hypothetical protein
MTAPKVRIANKKVKVLESESFQEVWVDRADAVVSIAIEMIMY